MHVTPSRSGTATRPVRRTVGERVGGAVAVVLLLAGCETDADGTQSSAASAGSGPTTTTAPNPSAVTTSVPAPVDTSSWLPFDSEHYGFSAAYPPDWEAHQGRGEWAFPDDTAWPDGVEVSDWFYLDDAELGSVAASVWSAPLEPGTSADQWFADYCAVEVTPCDGTEPTLDATLDGHAGKLVRSSDPLAYFGVGDRVYVLAVWQPDDHPAVGRYGGGHRLLEALVSTVRIESGAEAGAAESAAQLDTWLGSSWSTHASERYGFTVAYPPTWTVIESTHDWDQRTDSINHDSGGMEVFASPDDELAMYLAAWAVDVDPATTMRAWTQAFCDQYVPTCTDVQEMSRPASSNMGEQDGIRLSWDDGIVAFFPSWFDDGGEQSIWDQPAPADGRIHLIESGRPEGRTYRALEFVDAMAASLCVGCAT